MLFYVLNYSNCLIEGLAMLLMWRAVDARPFRWRDYLLTYGLMCLVMVVITLIDAVSVAILPLNLLMILAAFWVGFRRSFKETASHTLFVYLLLLYLQCFLSCFFPQSLLVTQVGYFIINGSVGILSTLLVLAAHKWGLARFFADNARMAWMFLAALCLPVIVLSQVLLVIMGSIPSAVVIIIVLLQLLYTALVVLVFSTVKRQSESRRLADVEKYIQEMNEQLTASRQSMHDFNKHIRYLRNAVAVDGRSAELTATVDAYCRDLLDAYEKEEALLQLDDPVLRAILYGRRTQAAAAGIDFILDASPVLPTFPLKNYQMVEVFDNLIDNAFECVTELPQETRWIRVTLSVTRQKDGRAQQLLSVENPYEQLDFSAIAADGPYTSKGGKHQGVGLKRVARTVNATGGKLILRNDSHNVFMAKIVYDM